MVRLLAIRVGCIGTVVWAGIVIMLAASEGRSSRTFVEMFVSRYEGVRWPIWVFVGGAIALWACAIGVLWLSNAPNDLIAREANMMRPGVMTPEALAARLVKNHGLAEELMMARELIKAEAGNPRAVEHWRAVLRQLEAYPG